MFKSPIEESFYFIESESSDGTDAYKLQSGQTSMQNGISKITAEVDIKCWLNIWAWQYCYVLNWNKTVGTYQINWQGRNDDKTRWRENIEETHKHTRTIEMEMERRFIYIETNKTKFIRLKFSFQRIAFKLMLFSYLKSGNVIKNFLLEMYQIIIHLVVDNYC